MTVDTEGELTSACANRTAGNAELAGEWPAISASLIERSQAADLIYMCVDEDVAYAPTETWSSSDGMACSCTEDYMISCETMPVGDTVIEN